MERLSKGIVNFGGYDHRSMGNSIYRKEISVDPYELTKIDNGKIKTTKNSGKSIDVNFGKQK